MQSVAVFPSRREVTCRAGRQDFCFTGDFTERGIRGRHPLAQTPALLSGNAGGIKEVIQVRS